MSEETPNTDTNSITNQAVQLPNQTSMDDARPEEEILAPGAKPSDEKSTASQPAPVAAQPTPVTQPEKPLVAVQKAQEPQPPPRPVVAPAPNPIAEAQQRGSKLKAFATALVGNPVETHYDPNTDSIVRSPAQLSGKQLALAIALEAISGGMAGLAGGRGKGAGGAAGAGLAQGQRIAQQRHQQQEEQGEQANQDYARHYQTMQHNMQMHMAAIDAGHKDLEWNQGQVAFWGSHLNDLKANHPEFLGPGHVGEKDSIDLEKYPAYQWRRVPDDVVARNNPATGKQVWGDLYGRIVPEGTANAYPQWDQTYQMVRKDAPASLTDDKGELQPWVKEVVKSGRLSEAWAKQNFGPNAPISGVAQSALMGDASVLNMAQDNLNSYYNSLRNGKQPAGQPAQPGTQQPLPKPNIADQKIATLIDDKATKYGIDPAVLRALVLTESALDRKKGTVNPTAVSKKGAQGLGQLMPPVQKQYGVTDPFDPEQNLEASAHYLSDLTKDKGSLVEGLRAYHGGGSDGITTDAQYVQKILGTNGAAAPASVPDVHSLAAGNPSLMQKLKAFQPLLAGSDGYIEKALAKMTAKDSAGAGAILSLYGGADAVRQHDKQLAQQDMDQRIEESGKKKAAEETSVLNAKAKNVIENNNELIEGLLPDKEGQSNMTSVYKAASAWQAHREIIIAETMRRAKERGLQWNPSEADGKIKLWEDAADGTKPGSFAQSVQNTKTIFGHLGNAMETLQKIKAKYPDLSNVKLAEHTLSWFNEQFGTDPLFGELMVNLRTGGTDWQNLLNNQHVLHEPDIKFAEKVSSGDIPIKALETNIRAMAHTGAIRALPLNDRWRSVFHQDYPDLLNEESARGIALINDPGVTRLMGHMRVNGSLTGSNTGAGIPGKTLKDFIQAKTHPQPAAAQPQASAGKPSAATVADAAQPPAGATVKVPGSDGKMHWSDGKVDLGVAE